MTQYECYEAALKKKFHIQMIAQRLGWLEDSRELRYAYRCSLQGQPRQTGVHWDHPEPPSPMSYLPQQRQYLLGKQDVRSPSPPAPCSGEGT